MNPRHPLDKLAATLDEAGVGGTAGEIAGFGRRSAASLVSGVPGHYQLQRRRLLRSYEPEHIEPKWVRPEAITGLSGSNVPRDDGHLDYCPQFRPREATWSTEPIEAVVPYGTVHGGDWDQTSAPIESLAVYQGIEEHLLEEVPWTETDYVANLISQFVSQGMAPSTATQEVATRCARIDSLANTLQTDGYRSQRQLHGHPLDEITVNISRENTLLYNCEGRHRLCLAKILGLARIPVLVLVRHEEAVGGAS